MGIDLNSTHQNTPKHETRLFTADEVVSAIWFFTQKQVPVEQVTIWGGGVNPLYSEKRYHYLYQTKNAITGEYYMGIHSTDDISDGYLGSGQKLLRSIKIHGKEVFSKDIIEIFDSRAFAVRREKEVVTKNLLSDPLCLNSQAGGSKHDIRSWIQKRQDDHMKSCFSSKPNN